jgi:Fe-S-cluster containining protein
MVACQHPLQRSTSGKLIGRTLHVTCKTEKSGWTRQPANTLRVVRFLNTFLTKKKTTCDIYHDRPEDCRHYPVDIAQMFKDDCEMLEPRDLNDLKRAQKKLDAIMIDSRPSVSK